LLPLLSGAGALLGATLLVWLVVRLVRLVRRAFVARVPLAAAQEVSFDAPGAFVLAGEGPRLTRAFRALEFSLAEASSGQAVVLGAVWLPTQTSGARSVRLSLRRFRLERAGRYLLRVEGLGPGAGDDPRLAIVFARPFGAALPLHIVGIIAAAFLTIGGIVLTALLAGGVL
jgi:hypothetical protein